MSNIYVDTWRIGRQLREDMAGYPMKVTIGSTPNIDADLEVADEAEIIVAGGKSEAGGQLIVVALEDCPGGVMPAPFTEVTTSRGYTAKWLPRAKENVGIVHAIIGQPLARDRKSSLIG